MLFPMLGREPYSENHGQRKRYKRYIANVLITPVIIISALQIARKRASSVWSDYQAHMRVRNWWKKLKNHESNYLHPERI